MREEYNSVVSIPTEACNIGRFGRYRYIGETQISARWIGLSLHLNFQAALETASPLQRIVSF